MTDLTNSDGEFADWEQVYRQHKDHVLTAAAYLVGGRRDVAEDILHDVFVSFCQKVELGSVADPRGFLVTACLNRARDWLRRAKTRFTEPMGDELIDSGSTPAEAGEINETREALLAAMMRLPPNQREIILLHVYGRLTFRAISGQLGISANTAKSRYRYAIAAMQKQLNQTIEERSL